MSYQNINYSYFKSQFMDMQPVTNNVSANFSQELHIFLYQHPQFLSNKSHLEFLRHCFVNYINCDPTLRDLPIREKLKQAGEMAIKFMGLT
jgi:hypothetical protein